MTEPRNIISSLDFFKGVSAEKAVSLLSCATKMELQKGELLFAENEKFPFLCILIEGEISLSISGMEISKLSAPQIIGEFGLVNKKFRRSIQAEVSEKSIMLKAEYREIIEKLEQDPVLKNKILLNLGRIVSNKLKANNLKLLELKESLENLETENQSEAFCPINETHLANQNNDRAYLFFPGIKGHGPIIDKGENHLVFLRNGMGELPKKRCMACVHLGQRYFLFTAKVLNLNGSKIKLRILNASKDLLISLNQVEF